MFGMDVFPFEWFWQPWGWIHEGQAGTCSPPSIVPLGAREIGSLFLGGNRRRPYRSCTEEESLDSSLAMGWVGGGVEDVWGRDGIGLTSNPRGFSFPPSDLSETSPKRHVVVGSTNPRKTKSRIVIFLRRERIGKVQPKTSEKKRGR